MTAQANFFRGKADARINGVACQIKLVLQPLGEEIAGVIGLPDHYPEPLVGFSLQGQVLRFIELAGRRAGVAQDLWSTAARGPRLPVPLGD